MSVAEQAIFEIVVKGDQAKRELGAVRSSAETLGGGLDKLNRGLNKFDGATRETQKVLRGLGDAMGGTKSKGLEFLGVAGDLAGAFASGGAFTAGMVAATFVITKVASAYNEATVNARAFKDGMPSIAASVTRLKDAALEPGRKSVADFAKQLADFGKDARQIAIDSQAVLVSQMGAGAGRLQSNEARQAAIVESIAREKVRGKKIDEEDYKLQIELLKQIRHRQAENERAGIEAKTALEEMRKVDGALRKREAAAKAAQGAGGGAGDEMSSGLNTKDNFSMAMIEEDPQEKIRRLAIEKRLTDEERAENELRDLRWKSAQEIAAGEERIREESQEIQHRKMLAEQEVFAAAMMDLTKVALVDTMQAATSTGLGVFNDYLAMKIEGEEMAEEKATAAFLKGIGNQLVGIGTRSLFEGGAKLFNPVTAPIGAAEMAFGGAAIAAGLGLGAGGAALAHTAAGGKVGSPIPDKATTERGVNSGKGGGGSTSTDGGFTINVTYGAAGPAPEQTAREVVRVVNTLRSRQGRAPDRNGPRSGL